MFRVMLWKEYREGRLVWGTLAGVGVATKLGVHLMSELFGTGHEHDDARVLLVLRVWLVVYGLIAGSLQLAGEREAGTLQFLDLLQPRRGALWVCKVLVVSLKALFMGALLAGLYWVAQWWNDRPVSLLEWDDQQTQAPLILIFLMALDAVPWGLAGSALCRGALPAVALATVGFLLTWLVASVFGQAPLAMLLVRVVFDLAALGASAVLFVQREPNGPPQGEGLTMMRDLLAPRIPAQGGLLRVQLWLCWRQGRTLIYCLLAGAVVLGFVLAPVIVQVWPLTTLGVGIICGLKVWDDEQAGGHAKFLGDRRLPLFRIWLCKATFWLVVCALVLTVAVLAAAASASVGRWHVGSMRGDGMEPLRRLRVIINPYLSVTMWALYGFTLAQLTVMIWRKPVVTFVLTFMGALAAAGLFLPSLVLGGLPTWQVLVPPLIWLVTGALLVWPWASVGITWRQVAVLYGCSGATALWIACCLAWRVVEVPRAPERFDAAAFQNDYPSAEKNRAPREMQAALGLNREPIATESLGPVPGPVRPPRPEIIGDEALATVLSQGWPRPWCVPAVLPLGGGAAAASTAALTANTAALGTALDRAFRGDWYARLEQAAHLPLGVVDDPTGNRTTLPNMLQRLRGTALLMSVRALQLEADGHGDESVRYLATVLAVSRHIRNRAPVGTLQFGLEVERIGLEAAERILPALSRDNPAAAGKLLTELNRHREELPPVEDNLGAEYLMIAQRLNGQNSALLERGGDPPLDARGNWNWLSEILATSLQTPWERERADRLFQVSYAQSLEALTGKPAPALDRGALGRSWLRSWAIHDWAQLRLLHEGSLCRLEALRLQLALSLYARDNGRPAASLEELTPRYLRTVPRDPFTGEAFGYRVSEAGDTIKMVASDQVTLVDQTVPEGQGILWSAGPDRNNEGGTMQSRGRATMRRNAVGDWIFLVPQVR